MLGGDWLAMSDYTRASDQIYFYDIRGGGQRPVYTAAVPGEIQFIAAGVWQKSRGFWAGFRQKQDDQERFLVQFWGKRDE